MPEYIVRFYDGNARFVKQATVNAQDLDGAYAQAQPMAPSEECTPNACEADDSPPKIAASPRKTGNYPAHRAAWNRFSSR